MELVDFTRFAASLAFVVGLIWFIGYGLRRSGLDKKLRGATGAQGRMQVMDVLYIDPKRKLVITRVDAREYLLLVTPEQASLLDTLPEKVSA